MIRWRHKVPGDALTPKPHSVDPHHAGTGDWCCFVCRGPIVDAESGRAVNMALTPQLRDALQAERESTIDPDVPNLTVEGS